ncbi:MAG: SDR family NAD(P)-dependent oxidoreductase, partial [Burkholderiaceae bacterium]
MDLQLSEQHVLITGGSKGIGLACARGFLREGARVSLVARDQNGLANARQHLLSDAADAQARIALVAADLREGAHAEQALVEAEAAFGPIDVLV